MKCICGKDIQSGTTKCSYCKRTLSEINSARAEKNKSRDIVEDHLDCEITLLMQENDFIEREIKLSNSQIHDYIETLNRVDKKLENVNKPSTTKNALDIILEEPDSSSMPLAGYKIRGAIERQLKDYYKLEIATKNGQKQKTIDTNFNEIEVIRHGENIFLREKDFVLNIYGRFVFALLSNKTVKKEDIHTEAQNCSAKWGILNMFVHYDSVNEKQLQIKFGEIDKQAAALKEYYEYFSRFNLIYK